VHRERPFFQGLVSFMCSGPIVVAALSADDAISRYRTLIGATDPGKAADGTIRKKFGTDVERNAVHGSDSPDNGFRETSFFFSGMELGVSLD
jgi:nucleoside-diphosphate kinase